MHLNSLLPIMCEHICKRRVAAELNDSSWTEPLLTWATAQTSPFSQPPPKSWMRYEVSLRKIRERERALWSYYESRLWSESGNCLWGNVKVSKISSTSKEGVYVWEDSSQNWDLMSEGYPFVCAWRGWQIPRSVFWSEGGLALSARGQRSLPYQTFKALTLEGNRGVRQIKQPYPVAAVCACVLW